MRNILQTVNENYCAILRHEKYVWAEDTYNSFFSLRVAFTNFHGSMDKLRDDDSARFNRLKNPKNSLRKEKKRKRLEQQS